MPEPHDRREAEAIRQQMEHVRGRMPYAMDIAREEAKQYLSWKYHVGRHPFSAAALTAAAAYWAAPALRRAKPGRDGRGKGRGREPDTAEVASKASVMGMITSLLTSLAVRGATTYFSGHLQEYLSQQAAAKRAGKGSGPKPERSTM